MNDYILLLEKAAGVFEFYLTKRKEYSENCLLETPLETGQSAYELFLHAAKTLYYYAAQRFPISIGDLVGIPHTKLLEIPIDKKETLVENMIAQIKKAVEEFTFVLETLPEEDYKNHQENIATIVMHTVFHLGMVVRTQKIFIENKLPLLQTN